jgi:hypothetical protein
VRPTGLDVLRAPVTGALRCSTRAPVFVALFKAAFNMGGAAILMKAFVTRRHVSPCSRAGTYQRQSTGYRTFIPTSLPPRPRVKLTGNLQRLLSQADLALGRLDGSIQTLPNPDLFVFMYVRKEAVLSSQIEGTQSSLQDLLAAEAQLYTSTPKDVDEVVNYVAAMNYGLERLSDLPVSVRLIREIHKKLLDGVRGSRLAPGELRRSQNLDRTKRLHAERSNFRSAASQTPTP